jgi:hypothetical protein
MGVRKISVGDTILWNGTQHKVRGITVLNENEATFELDSNDTLFNLHSRPAIASFSEYDNLEDILRYHVPVLRFSIPENGDILIYGKKENIEKLTKLTQAITSSIYIQEKEVDIHSVTLREGYVRGQFKELVSRKAERSKTSKELRIELEC